MRLNSIAAQPRLDRLAALPPQPFAQAVAVDAFLARPSALLATAAVTPDDARLSELVANAYRTVLGREPDPEGYAGWLGQAHAWASLGASDTDIATTLTQQFRASDEAVQGLVQAQYHALLGRDADPEGLAGFSAAVRQQLAEGLEPDAIAANVASMIQSSEEFRLGHLDALVEGVYGEVLGRHSDPEGLAGWTAQASAMRDAGSSAEEIHAALVSAFQQSPEYLQAHGEQPSAPAPTGRNSNRDELLLQQPNGWTCGPTTLAMAMAAFGLRPANGDTIDEMTSALRARPGVGTPGDVSYVAQVARGLGLDANASRSQSAGDMRAELEAGRGVIVNGGLSTGGHFLYLAGIAEDGRFIVCDPFRPGVSRFTDAELERFCHTGSHPPGFVSVGLA